MTIIARLLLVFSFASLVLSGCRSREAPRGHAPRPAAEVGEPGPAVSDRPKVLATVPDDAGRGDESRRPSNDPHAVPAPRNGERVFVFAERGGGVAWIDSGGGKSRVVHNGRAGRAYAAVGTVSLSLDGRRIAYGADVGGEWRMVVDGKEGDAYRALGDPVFSPDGRHLAYKAQLQDGWHLVVDGKASPDPVANISGMGFSGDSLRIAVVEAAGGDAWGRLVVTDVGQAARTVVAAQVRDLLLNSARTRLVAVEKLEKGQRTITVGFDRLDQPVLGPPQDNIASVAFAGNGVSVACLATRSGRFHVIVDDEDAPLPLEDNPVGDPVVSRDGSAIGIPVISPSGSVVVREPFPGGAAPSRGYEGIEDLVYANDGRGYAAAANRAGAYFVVVDGKEGPAFDRVVTPAFTPDGKHVVYRARKGDERFVVVADREGRTIRQHPGYEQVFPVRFTSDGGSVAYGVKDGKRLRWAVEPL